MGRAIEPEGGMDALAWLAAVPEAVAGWLGAADRAAGSAGPDAARGVDPPAGAGELALAPGMPVEVHLRTGDRSPLGYLVKPLTDYFSRSMREE